MLIAELYNQLKFPVKVSQKEKTQTNTGFVFLYKLRYIVGFGLVKMAIPTTIRSLDIS